MEHEYWYNSFDGTRKQVFLGADYFKKIKEEKKHLNKIGLDKEIKDGCLLVFNKKEAIEKLGQWKLPHNIFTMMPKWWKKNDIQEMSPAVIAVHEVIKESLDNVRKGYFK